MTDSSAENDLNETSRIQRELFGRYAGVGVPILRDTQAYTRAAIEGGEPGYISRGFEAARGAAGTNALQAELGLRGQLRGREGGNLLQGLVGATAAGGRAFAEETSATRASQAMNQVGQRNQLFRILSGQGAQNTDLSIGFGRLGLQGIGAGALQGGDPVFEAVLGLGAAGSAGYLDWLTQRPPQLPGATNTFSNVYQSHPGTRR
jgi:hypothetical protein